MRRDGEGGLDRLSNGGLVEVRRHRRRRPRLRRRRTTAAKFPHTNEPVVFDYGTLTVDRRTSSPTSWSPGCPNEAVGDRWRRPIFGTEVTSGREDGRRWGDAVDRQRGRGGGDDDPVCGSWPAVARSARRDHRCPARLVVEQRLVRWLAVLGTAAPLEPPRSRRAPARFRRADAAASLADPLLSRSAGDRHLRRLARRTTCTTDMSTAAGAGTTEWGVVHRAVVRRPADRSISHTIRDSGSSSPATRRISSPPVARAWTPPSARSSSRYDRAVQAPCRQRRTPRPLLRTRLPAIWRIQAFTRSMLRLILAGSDDVSWAG